jgi:predicted O-methyltransferase YrrM
MRTRPLLLGGAVLALLGGGAFAVGFAAEWGAAAVTLAAALTFIGLAMCAVGAFAAARQLVRTIRSIHHYTRITSERTAAMRRTLATPARSTPVAGPAPSSPPSPASTPPGAGRTLLLVAFGDESDSVELDRFVTSNHGRVVLVTDVAELVARLAKDAVVEYAPTTRGSTGSELASTAVRLVELAVENRAEQIAVWPDVAALTPLSSAELGDLTTIDVRLVRSLLQVDEGVRRQLDHESARAMIEQGCSASAERDAELADRVDAVGSALAEFERASTKRREAAVRELRANIDALYRQLESFENLTRRLDGERVLPPMRGWAVSPDLAQDLVERVITGGVGSVLEVGSGSSTVLFAMAFDAVGAGHVTSLEHDASYARATAEMLERFGLTNRATVVTAPLVEQVVGDESYRWYDIAAVPLPTGIDLLFVDGPPEATGPNCRFPAVPMLSGQLADRATIILDDGRRPAEAEVAELWSRLPDIGPVVTLPYERSPLLMRFRRDPLPAE